MKENSSLGILLIRQNKCIANEINMAIETWEMNQEGAVSWKSAEESFQGVTDGCIVEGIAHLCHQRIC